MITCPNCGRAVQYGSEHARDNGTRDSVAWVCATSNADLPTVYKVLSIDDGRPNPQWSVTGLGIEQMPTPLFEDQGAAQQLADLLNRAYQLGHTFGRTAGK